MPAQPRDGWRALTTIQVRLPLSQPARTGRGYGAWEVSFFTRTASLHCTAAQSSHRSGTPFAIIAAAAPGLPGKMRVMEAMAAKVTSRLWTFNELMAAEEERRSIQPVALAGLFRAR